MNKIKKSFLLLGVALALSTPIIGLVPLFSGTASAATLQGSYTNIEELRGPILDHQYYFFLMSCFIQMDMDKVPASEVKNWEWFKTTNAEGHDADAARGGMYEVPEGDCENGPWIEEGFSRFGMTDPIEAFCALSFTFNTVTGGNGKDVNGGHDAAACRNGVEGGKDSDGIGGGGSGDRKKQQTALDKLLQTAPNYNTAKSSLTKPQEFIRVYDTLMKGCDVLLTSVYDEASDPAKDNKELVKVPIVRNGTDSITYAAGLIESDGYYGGELSTQLVANRAGNDDDEWVTCDELAVEARSLASAYKDYLAAQDLDYTDVSDDDTAGTGLETPVECADEWSLGAMTNPLDWLSCSLLKGMVSATKAFDNVIAGLLCINESTIFPGADATCNGIGSAKEGSANAFHGAWNVFRVIALGLLAIGGLIMVISQGLGFELFDSYTVKRTLPRLLVAAIGISLSWEIMNFLITLSNGLGIGIRSLIYAPFNDANIGIDPQILGGGELAIGALFTGGAFIALGAIGLLSFIGTAALAVLIALFTLIIRNMLVILLILAAPIAIAAYILPNTEKYFKTWWDWLIKALLVFPIIAAFIAIGHVFAAITSTNGNTLASFVAFGAYFAPYFLIPLAFRFAGGLMATLGGFANDRSRGGFDRLKGLRKNEAAKNWQAVKAGRRYRGGNETNFRGKINKGLAGGANAPGALFDSGTLGSPTKWRGAVRSAMQANAMSEVEQNMKENHAYQPWAGNDDVNKAAALSNDATGLRAGLIKAGYEPGSRDLEDTINHVESVRRSMSPAAFKAMTTRAAIAGGTAFKTDGDGPKTAAGEVMAAIAQASVNDEAMAGSLVANARSDGMKAGRLDYAGAGFGTTISEVNKMRKTLQEGKSISQADIESATRAIHADAYKGQGGASLVHSSMKPDSVKEMVPEILSDLETARMVGATQEEKDNNFTQSLASLAAVYDGMQGSSPGKAKIMADEVFSKSIDIASLSPEMKERLGPTLRQPIGSGDDKGAYTMSTGTITYQQAIDGLRGNTQFKEMRREYSNEVERQLGRGGQQEPGSDPNPIQ